MITESCHGQRLYNHGFVSKDTAARRCTFANVRLFLAGEPLVDLDVKPWSFFINCPQYNNVNIVNFILSVPLERNCTNSCNNVRLHYIFEAGYLIDQSTLITPSNKDYVFNNVYSDGTDHLFVFLVRYIDVVTHFSQISTSVGCIKIKHRLINVIFSSLCLLLLLPTT